MGHHHSKIGKKRWGAGDISDSIGTGTAAFHLNRVRRSDARKKNAAQQSIAPRSNMS